MDWSVRASEQYQVRSLNLALLKPFEAFEGEAGGSLLSDLVVLYLRVAPEDLVNLRSAVYKNDLILIHQLAHGFKSSSANLGAELLAEICQKLEDHTDPEARPSNVDVRSIFSELEVAYRLAERDLNIVHLLLKGLPIPQALARVA